MKRIQLIFCFALISLLSSGQSYFDSTWTQYFRRNSGGWTAGDASISVHLPDNRVIWLFGDSYTVNVAMNNTLPCLFQVRNCMMVQDSADRSSFVTILDTTQTGVNQTTFKIRPDDTTLLWPGAGYFYNDTVYLFFENYSSSTLAYKGCYIAKLEYPSLRQAGLVHVHDNGPSIFGRALYLDEQAGKLYIYGNKLNWIVYEPVVARCDPGNPAGTWEYFNGSSWSLAADSVAKISDEPVSPSFSVFRKDDRFVMITQENGYLECGLGREIWSMESNDAAGPFGMKRLLYTEESMFNGHYLLTYNAQAHPWAEENNELLICYNVNDRVDTIDPFICPSQCQNIFTDRLDADTYRPKFIRVPLNLITGVKQNVNPDLVSISPNPVDRSSEITISVPDDFGNGRIVICDLSGRMIRERFYSAADRKEVTLISPEQPGIYLLLVRGESSGKCIKMIVR